MSSEWTLFDETKWDEPSYIFCNSCQSKNRANSGWYRRTRKQSIEYDRLKQVVEQSKSLGYPIRLQNKEYKCAYCWLKEHPNPRKCSLCKETGHTKRRCTKKPETGIHLSQ